MAREELISGPHGLKIFVRSWRPESLPRGLVVIVPGANSHSGYYLWAGEQLAAHGLVVYALDLHGRGRSEGERFYLEKLDDYLEDVATVVVLAQSREPSLPVYLLGHGEGGVVACVYALEHQQALAGLICESFALEVPAPTFTRSAVKGLSMVAPHLGVLRLKNEDFSRDPYVVEIMDCDPLIARERQPSKTVAELTRADERLRREFSKITLPVLIMHGTADRATLPSGSWLFHERAGSVDKTLKLYDGYAHDLLNDLGKELVMGDILLWLDRQLTPRAEPAALPELRV